MSLKNEILATNLKKYNKLSGDVYKVLISYHYSGNREARANLTEKEFAPAISEMFNGEICLIPNTLVDYKAFNNDMYKTCLVTATTKIIPVSNATIASTASTNNFTTLAKNVFLDPNTNNIWKKVVTESGVIQLVKEVADNLEDLIKKKLDYREAVASANPIWALQANKFDYAFFFNPSTKVVETGFVLGNDNAGNVTIASRQQQKPVTINEHFVIAGGDIPNLTQQFERDLKNSKNAYEVMQTYLNFWFKTDAAGSNIADDIEKALKTDAFKSTASVDGDLNSIVDEIKEEQVATKENDSLTKEEIEVAITSKFDEEQVNNFALVESKDNDFICKFTKQGLGVDNIVYIVNKLNDIFKICPCIEATDEFVHFILSPNK